MLGYDEILTIYKYISMDFTASQIAMQMNIAPSTLYRIIARNTEVKQRNNPGLCYRYHDCEHLSECRKKIERCPAECERFEKHLCGKLRRFPFVCDFCGTQSYCTKARRYWNPVLVYENRRKRQRRARSHLSLSKARIAAFDDWLAPFIKKKLSIEAVRSRFPEAFPVSTATVRRWIDKGHMSIRRIDLPRAATFRAKNAYALRRPSEARPLLKFGHTYPYFLAHLKAHPEASVIEMDTVHGLAKEERKLLTFYHRQSHLQFAVLIPDLRPASVSGVVRTFQRRLAPRFTALFDVILADNGVEFDDLITSSVDSETGEVLSRVFYTRPYRAGDKGGCERNHELFRSFVPKGHGLSELTQKDIDFMFSMINSYPRESLNWKAPIDVFKHYFPEETLDLLSLRKVPLEDLTLKR
ncbi:MAG: IS30 family transposase [Candidatus Izemoplasmatales bacterium]